MLFYPNFRTIYRIVFSRIVSNVKGISAHDYGACSVTHTPNKTGFQIYFGYFRTLPSFDSP
ncbi:hypothetical protein Plhal304r1_c044g0124231 [Plasmopara halstedii]